MHAQAELNRAGPLIWVWGRLALGFLAAGAMGAEIAADFTLPVHGTNQTASLYSHAGKVIVLEFWWGGCSVCQAAAPDVRANVRDYFNARGGNTDGLPVKLIYINVYNGDNTEDWFIRTYGLDYVLDDYEQTVFRRYASSVPTFLVINGVTNSTTHQPWEVVYKRIGYDSSTTTEIRNAVNSIRGTLATRITGPRLVTQGTNRYLEWQFFAQKGRTNIVQAKRRLFNTNEPWLDLTNLVGTNVLTFRELNPSSNRFFRIRTR